MATNIVTKKIEATEVITHDVTPLTVNTDAKVYSKLGWLIVVAGLGGFLLWASLAPLDKGVPLSGAVEKESNRKAIQHQSGGTVQDILVHDGDVVKAGQVLVRMNDVLARSQMEVTRAQYVAARATEARLVAERDGLKGVPFPASLQPYKDDPQTKENMALQAQLFESRQMALKSEIGAMDENIAGLKSQADGLSESRDSKKAELGFLKEQLENTRDLAKDGYIPRSRLLELERTYAQIGGQISEDIGNIAHARNQIAEVSLHRIQRTQEYQKEVRTQLADVQKEADATGARLQSQVFDLSNVDVKSPVDGIIVGMAVFTRGGVVQPGFRMMEVVPTQDALVVEGQLAVNLIDKVHTGLPVELMFSAFNTNRTPHIPGELTTIAADRSVDEKTGQPYYKVRARVTPAGLKLLAEKKLVIQSGMPVEMFIKTGERTMMSYLLKPVFDRSKSSMAED